MLELIVSSLGNLNALLIIAFSFCQEICYQKYFCILFTSWKSNSDANLALMLNFYDSRDEDI